MNILSSRLKATRKAKHMTQRELATLSGMDQGHISRLENGEKGISMEHLQSLAKALNVSVSYLVDNETKETASNYKTGGTRSAMLADYEAPAGLRDLASDTALIDALKITDEEWKALDSIELHENVSKDGYVQLLITIRAISA